MTTAHSFSMPPREPREGDGGAWPVLARIPNVSPNPPDRRAAQSSSPPAVPVRSPNYRVDPGQAAGRRSTAAQVPTAREPERVDHSAHASQPPAHHLRRRAAQAASPDRKQPADSPVLPSWDPFQIPGSRLPDSFAPILSFLVLVALFTAAGTSLLMLRGSGRESAAESTRPTKKHVAQPIAGPTAAGPRGRGDVRLEPAPPAAPTAATAPPDSAPALTPSPNDAATNDAADRQGTTPVPATPDDKDFAPIDYPSPVFPEAFPKTSELPLPQAQMTDKPPAVARFSGGIQEAQPR